MEYVRIIIRTVMKPAVAYTILSHSISFSCCAIRIPTTTRAGAVTAFVTADSTIGENRMDTKNSIPVVQAVKPVLPPTSTPEVDSTKEVTVEVPKAAPATVPTASATSARSTFSNSPFSFTRPMRFATATSVPAVSKKSTNRKEKITTNAFNGFANNSPKPSTKEPAAFRWKFISKNLSGNAGIPFKPNAAPQMIPIIAVITIPTKTAAGTFLTSNAIVSRIPKSASNTCGSAKSPKQIMH